MPYWEIFAVCSEIGTTLSTLDFCLTVHHQLGKVIQMNQLDATMIYLKSSNSLLTVHIVPRCRSPSPCPPEQQDTICCKYLSLTLLMMGKILPETC